MHERLSLYTKIQYFWCHPGFLLEVGELLGLVAGVLGVDELGQQELLELHHSGVISSHVGI